jgi:hypothetical protein
MLSFPKPGISIALDIAVRRDTQALIDALNEQVIKEGGRIYLAKDAFHARRALPRDGPARRRVPARPPQVGSARQAAQRAVGAPVRGRAAHLARGLGVNVAILGATRGMGRRSRRCSSRAATSSFHSAATGTSSRPAPPTCACGPARPTAVAGVAVCDLEEPGTFGPALAPPREPSAASTPSS